MKTYKRILSWSVSLFLIWLLFTIWFPFDLIVGNSAVFKYNNVMRTACEKNPNLYETPITEIAMLGAHDSLTSEITLNSVADTAQAGNFANSWYGSLAKGLVVRWSKAQQHNILTQLNAGVRYIDVRISYINEQYYNAHGLVSGTLETSLKQIITFLNKKPGEFVLFHIVHAYLGESTFDELATYISSVKVDGKSLYDFVNYNIEITSANMITYNNATQNGTKGGVVIISCEDENMVGSYASYYNLNDVRSNWHNQINTQNIIKMANDESELIKKNKTTFANSFRINQLQTTPNFSEIGGSIFSWALTTKAQEHNSMILNSEYFEEWLSSMPIVMVDFATSTKHDFNRKVNEKIIQYNIDIY